MLTMFSVNKCIENVEKILPTRNEAEIESLNKTATIDDLMTLSSYQQRKSIALMGKKIDKGVAMWLYNLMGECGIDKFNGAPLAHRITALEVMVAIMK
jgi:hypothetical protein